MHEHPHDAASWAEDCIAAIPAAKGVETATVDMCVHCMLVDVGPLQGPARNINRIMSNSKGVLRRVAATCQNIGPDTTFHHVHVPPSQDEPEDVKFTREMSVDEFAKESQMRRDCAIWIGVNGTRGGEQPCQ